MASPENADVSATQELKKLPRRGVSRTRIATGVLSFAGLGAAVGVPLLQSAGHSEPLNSPPGISAPDTTPSLSVPPSVEPTIPVFPTPSLSPSPSTDAVVFPAKAPPSSLCETQRDPREGTFDKNTGIHTLSATLDHPSLAVITPDRSDVQQMRWRLPNQGSWITLNPGSNSGIIVRSSTDIQMDTSNNRAAWVKMCAENPVDARDEVPSRVRNVFERFPLGEVVVYTIMKEGYIVQEVPRGQSYSQNLPYQFIQY